MATKDGTLAHEIEKRLRSALSPTTLTLVDQSADHIGHAGAKDGAQHFAVTIVSDQFTGLAPLKRHRLVYAAVENLIPQRLHALSIDAKTPL